jgi:alkylhydroperoxidase family enzyme
VETEEENMFLINTIEPETNKEPFRTVYNSILSQGLPLPAPLELMSASEPLFKGYAMLLRHFAEQDAISPALRTAIRYHVACISGFQACIAFNGALLERLGMSGVSSRLAAQRPEGALPAREQRLLDFVSDALFRPNLVNKTRIETMNQDGFTDQTLFDAVMHGAMLLMMGPVVDAFTE